jgi:1-acyl-sn-glycerol-3-phosphate acyltransferase
MARIKPYAIVPFLLQKGVLVILKPLFSFFTKIEAYGMENIKNLDGRLIFASNHSSELDPMLIPIVLPLSTKISPMFYVSRGKNFYDRSGWRKIFYGGLLFKMFGAYPAYSGYKNYEKSMANHIPIVNDGFPIHIFPEGQRTLDGNIGSARGGVCFLSYHTNTPVVPVLISGVYKMNPVNFLLRKRKIIVIFGKSQFFKYNNNPTVDNFKNNSNELMKIISQLAR